MKVAGQGAEMLAGVAQEEERVVQQGDVEKAEQQAGGGRGATGGGESNEERSCGIEDRFAVSCCPSYD